PLSPQVLGGRATRSTHPQTLVGFEKLFSHLFECDFAVENPFAWKTRTHVLSEIKAAGHGDLCALTSSCTHTIAMTTEHTHCGRCSQCVDRRISSLAAGLDETEDPPIRYRSDVLVDPRDGADLILVERYHGTALTIDGMSEALD